MEAGGILEAFTFVIVFGLLCLSSCLVGVVGVAKGGLSSCLVRVVGMVKGGWLPLIFSLIVLSVMYIWHYVTLQKQSFESHNRTSLDMLLILGTNIGINRVRGVGLVYTNVLSEIPPMFSHFVTNVPAFHHVLIIVTFQYLTIPRVFCQSAIYCKPDWFPPEFRLHLCIARLRRKEGQSCF